jgi:hypothetical protein
MLHHFINYIIFLYTLSTNPQAINAGLLVAISFSVQTLHLFGSLNVNYSLWQSLRNSLAG